jgi:hypothetical protein
MSGIKKIFWIDSMDNHEDIEQILSTNHQKNFEFFPFKNLKNAFDELSKINFEIIFVVLRGNLYQDYFSILNNVKSRLTCLPISIIYTSNNFNRFKFQKLLWLYWYYYFQGKVNYFYS